MKSRPQIMLEFVEAIEALGGTVHPIQVHDLSVTIDVPSESKERAKALLDKLTDDLAKARPS